MTPVRLLIWDVDGTLVKHDQLVTERTREAVARLRAADIQLVVTSGRPPRGMAKIAKELGLTAPMAAFNGGMLVRPDLEVIEQKIIPLAVAREAVDHLLRAGADVWVYRGADWFVGRTDAPWVAREQRNVGFEPIVTDVRAVVDGAVKIVGVSEDPVLLGRCETELRNRVGIHAWAARSQPYTLEITHADANTGMVARLASLFTRIPLEQVAAIGDLADDVFLFGVVGVSIAMRSSPPELQRAARYVTTSNEEDGFANAVDWFLFGDPRPNHRTPTLGLPSRTRACLFDLDGVLTQTAKLHAAAWKEMFDAYLRERSKRTGEPFVPFDPVADYGPYVDGKMRVDGARSFLASRGLAPPTEVIEELCARKDRLVGKLLDTALVATYGGSIQYVRQVRKAGIRTAVVSASKHCEEVLRSAGIADLFDARVDGLVAAREHLAGKPAPDTFLAAARRLGVAPADAAVFEDALAGVEAGRAGHFGYVIGVDREGRAAELRRHGADAVVTHLSELLEPP